MTARQLKDRACELSEGYEEAMKQDLRDTIEEYIESADVDSIYSDDIAERVEQWNDELPEEGDWALSQAESEYEGYMDSKYEQMKDERMERENEDNT